MLKKSKGNRFHQQGFIFSTFPINFIICLIPYRKASITGAFFIKESEDKMGVRVVFPDMGKDPSIQLIEKTITENGTYDAITDGANGYSKVNVNVEGGGGSSDFSTAKVTINITNFEEGKYYSLFGVPMVESGVVVGQDYDVETATELLTIPIGSNGARFKSFSKPTAITGNATYEKKGHDITITVTGDAVISFEIEK